MTAEDFAQLEDYELQYALQMIAGYMAVDQAKMREKRQAHMEYMAAKEDFAYLKSIASTIQTLLRTKV